MKKLFFVLMFSLLGATAKADMEDRTLGLGVIVGNPTGFSLNYKLQEDRSIDAALAYDLSGDDEIYLHSTYLFRRPHSLDLEVTELGWYAGIGGRVIIDNGPRRDDDVRVGVRGSIGANFEFKTVPLEIFGELAPVIDFIEDTDLDFDAGIGVRYYF